MIVNKCIIRNLSNLYNLVDNLLISKVKLADFVASGFSLINNIEDIDVELHNELISLIGNIDIEYAFAINDGNEPNMKNITNYALKIKSIIYKINENFDLDINAKHISLGYSIGDSLLYFIEQSNTNIIKMVQIVEEGKNGFQLNQLELINFVKYIIINLLNKGLKVFKKDKFSHQLTNEYGTKPEEIAENIIKEWKETKGTDKDISDISGVWFALPEIYKRERPQD